MLHDDIAQVLSAAGLQLDILRMDLAEAVPGIASRTDEIQKLLDHAVKRVRDLSYELNPPVAERAGLQSGAEWLQRALDATNSSDFGHAIRYVEAGLSLEPNNAELAQASRAVEVGHLRR